MRKLSIEARLAVLEQQMHAHVGPVEEAQGVQAASDPTRPWQHRIRVIYIHEDQAHPWHAHIDRSTRTLLISRSAPLYHWVATDNHFMTNDPVTAFRAAEKWLRNEAKRKVDAELASRIIAGTLDQSYSQVID